MESVLGVHNLASEIVVKIDETGNEQEYIKKFREIGIDKEEIKVVEESEVLTEESKEKKKEKDDSDRTAVLEETNKDKEKKEDDGGLWKSGSSAVEKVISGAEEMKEEVEKEHIRQTLKLTHNNRADAAQILHIGERTLYRKIKEYDL